MDWFATLKSVCLNRELVQFAVTIVGTGELPVLEKRRVNVAD